jgi:hypothetical protein
MIKLLKKYICLHLGFSLLLMEIIGLLSGPLIFKNKVKHGYIG